MCPFYKKCSEMLEFLKIIKIIFCIKNCFFWDFLFFNKIGKKNKNSVFSVENLGNFSYCLPYTKIFKNLIISIENSQN